MVKSLTFGKRLRALRKIRGWTQAELSEISGLTRSHISRLEAGDVNLPARDSLLRLAEALGTNPDDLLTAAGYRQDTHDADDLPDLPAYLRLKYAVDDPRTVAAVAAILETMREFDRAAAARTEPPAELPTSPEE